MTLVLTLGATPAACHPRWRPPARRQCRAQYRRYPDRKADAAKSGHRLVVIGGGYIGLEAAAVARKLGL